MDNLDDLDDLVNELRNTKSLTSVVNPSPIVLNTAIETINDDNVDDFIYRKASTVIQQGIDVIESAKKSVTCSGDAETLDAYSKMIASVSSSIEILNKINLQKRKEKAAEKLKKMDIESKTNLLEGKSDTNIRNQTNVIVATRDEIMKMIMNKADGIINATTTDAVSSLKN